MKDLFPYQVISKDKIVNHLQKLKEYNTEDIINNFLKY